MSSEPTKVKQEHAKRRAKRLLKAAREGDEAALARFGVVFDHRSDVEPTYMRALHVIAREYGYKKWDDLVASNPDQGEVP